MLNRIVPALGVIALATPAITAQEIAKGVFLDGWADNVASYTAEGYSNTGNDAIGFSTAAKLKVGWNVTDKVTGKVGFRFNNTDKAAGTGSTADAVYLQDAFVSANFGDGYNATFGKFINHLGLQAMEPTGLYRVNLSPTAAYYGNDVTGVSAGWSNDQVAASILVTNGFFDTKDQYGQGDAAAKSNPSHTLGYGFDLTYNLPEKMGNVNFEAAWDPASAANASDIYQLGVNATIKPCDKSLVAGEVIYNNKVDGTTDKKGKPDTLSTVAWMLLGNYVVSTEGVPASVTLSFAQDVPGFMNDGEANGRTTNEAAFAVLTNPFGSSSFGLNVELAHKWQDQEHKNASSMGTDGDTTIAVEGLVVIP